MPFSVQDYTYGMHSMDFTGTRDVRRFLHGCG